MDDEKEKSNPYGIERNGELIDLTTFGGRLYYMMKSKKYLQKDFASEIGVTERALYSYISNKSKPNTSTIIKIADVLSTSIDYLLGRYDSVNDPVLAYHYIRDMLRDNGKNFDDIQIRDCIKDLMHVKK